MDTIFQCTVSRDVVWTLFLGYYMLYGLCSWDNICCMDSVPGIIYVVWTLFLGYYMLYGLFHYMLYGLCFRDNIELYGALKRLLEWNNSDFKFMNLLTDVQDNDRFEPWVTMLRGQITTLHHFDISLADTIWKGAIQIVGTNVGTLVHGPTEVPMQPPHDPPWVVSNCSVDPQEWFKRCCHFLNWSMHQWRSFY